MSTYIRRQALNVIQAFKHYNFLLQYRIQCSDFSQELKCNVYSVSKHHQSGHTHENQAHMLETGWVLHHNKSQQGAFFARDYPLCE